MTARILSRVAVSLGVLTAAALTPTLGADAAGHAVTTATNVARPPTTGECRFRFGVACYSPTQLRRAYNVGAVWRNGHRGRGTTIAIVDSFGSPTIRHDLQVFDRAFGLPAPPRFRIVQPAGPVTKYEGGWAVETSLDVEYAHAMAPKANIILVETPTAETEGVHGFPDMMKSERWLIRNTKTTVISQSFDATEETFPSDHAIRKLRYAYKAAARHHVTVLAASGDTGVTNYTKSMKTVFHHRANCWPSTDPLVTSVGGTVLHLDRQGRRTKPDHVWHDATGASGGGRSHVFARPSFQDSIAPIAGPQRATPDISMNAAGDSSFLVFFSFTGAAQWQPVSGTSGATPLFAGIVSLAADVANHRLGRINWALYHLNRQTAGIVDVTVGNNNWAGVDGFDAKPGYDMASGVGTLNAEKFVPALAKAAG